MELFGLVGAVVMLLLLGAGFAIGLAACAIAAVLLGLGVISSSLVVGFWSGRPAHGLRAFLIQCGILLGIPAGAVCAWLGKAFITAYGSELPILAAGALGGALAGLAIGLSLDFVARRFHAWASTRFLPAGATAPRPLESAPRPH